jgi:glutathione synthase/RimK-type ligase-like ATP-grasp enzyme
VRAFQRRHRRVVYKSTDGGRSIVRELTTETAYDLERIRNLPTEFQAYVPGTDIRVHVVGSEVYATRVVSAAIDYRYAEEDGLGVAMDAHSLPNEIEARCRELSRTLELPFCGVDLRVTPNGQYHCFEVNPSPVFSDYQERTGQAIAEALVGYLAGLQENGG